MTTDRLAGEEPIPGYVLVEPLGRGGFGEVWKCVAPGGLHKAVKFVPAGGDQFRQEHSAFEKVRAIRHAFLLTLERVELVGGDLVMVMELADAQLLDRFEECRRDGRHGIPRDELLRYMSDAAEALDVISSRYGLQHLDVKPANLFLIDGHVKVGDYGLVRSLMGADQSVAGLTPKYAAPEVLLGNANARSDQYSLALVYHEMLTGSFPYPGRNAQQLMLQHVGMAPDLSALPEADRPAIARALAKAPVDRFPNCLAFVRSLSGPSPSWESLTLPAAPPTTPESLETQRVAVGTSVTPPPAVRPQVPDVPQPIAKPEPALIPAVAWVPRLRPRPAREGEITAAQFVEALVSTVKPDAKSSPPDGSQSCRFLCTLTNAQLLPRLSEMANRFGFSIAERESGTVLLRRTLVERGKANAGMLCVSIRRSAAGLETTATAWLEGDPGFALKRDTMRAIPGVLAAARGALENSRERRVHPRYPSELPVRIHPIVPDSSIGEFEDGLCEDISSGGIRFLTRVVVPVERVYLEFRSIEGIAGNALLATVLRSAKDPQGCRTSCRFDLT